MYLCMCTPDLYFTSTKVLIRLQNKSSKIHSTKEQLLFPSTNTCSGGLHGLGHRHLNTLKQFSTLMFKWKCRQQVKSPVGAGNSTKHWSSLALPSCSSHLLWGASLLGFWSTIFLCCSWCSQKENWGDSMFPSSPAVSRKGISGCSLLAKGDPGWGDRQVRAGSWDTWWSHSVLASFLRLKKGCSVSSSQLSLHTTNIPRILHMKVTEVPLVLTNRHLLQMFLIKSFPYILKFLERDSETKPIPTTAAGCLLATTTLTYPSTAIMRGILQYLTSNNPCSLNEICL